MDGLGRLEFPVGRELYKSQGYISDIRVSPDGQRVLFMDHPSANDDRGSVRIAEKSGPVTTVSADLATQVGTAWTPDGRRVLYSGSESGQLFNIWIADAPAPNGNKPTPSLALSVPGSMIVIDVAADGSLLTAADNRRYMVGARLKGSTHEQDMSWLDQSWAQSLSADGSLMLFADGHGGAGY